MKAAEAGTLPPLTVIVEEPPVPKPVTSAPVGDPLLQALPLKSWKTTVPAASAVAPLRVAVSRTVVPTFTDPPGVSGAVVCPSTVCVCVATAALFRSTVNVSEPHALTLGPLLTSPE